MTIRQLSIFIPDKAGALVSVLEVLKEGGHQILTSTLADTQDFAIYRVLCTKPVEAYMSLREAGYNVMMTDVIALEVDDKPGMAADAISVIAKAGVSIKYMYSFLLAGKGILVLSVNEVEKAKEVIMLNRLHFTTEEELDALIQGLRN